jgi:hypothetical protein
LASAEQIESESYRVILLGRAGTEILLVPEGERSVLPSVEIPRWQRVAESLTAGFKSDWGAEVVCLFELPTESADCPAITRYQAAEHLCTRSNPKVPTRWIPVTALGRDSSLVAPDYAAIKQVVRVCNGEINGVGAGPFVRLGWFRELRDWIESVIEPMGFHTNGEFRQLNASASFSLVRFETDGPALWFKAVGEPNQREFGITRTLARLFPRHLPCVLATRTEWNGWITPEAEGEILCDSREHASWRKVACDLAELQVDSRLEAQSILATGARDLRLGSLSRHIQPFVNTAQQIMERQPQAPPPILGHEQLLSLADRIRGAIDFLEPLGMPECLGHLDVNPGNVLVSTRGCIFLDWAEAYVGNPFLTFQYLLEHFRRMGGYDSSQESELVESYVAPWLRILSREVIDAALAVSPLLAVFAYATATGLLNDDERLEDAQFAGYLRSLVRRMDREARARADGSGECGTELVVPQI